MSDLTHLDSQGRARMVEVGGKPETERVARAAATVSMSPATLALLTAGPKGDAAAAARIAGIMAAKRTSSLIPLCHPLQLTGVEVEVRAEPPDRVEIEATVRTFGRTGVEMEALTAVSVAALAIYDMLKAVERGIVIGPVRLLEKSGGRSGTWVRPR